MEPLETDIDYMGNPPASQARAESRLSVLFIFPIIGLLLVLLFISAAIFQFDLSDLVDSIVGLLLFLFIALIVLLFWALAPRVTRS